ncbi:MAG: Grx4 family monothiol glutaredoxin [Gammaproteobacteria bacterium]|nr:MAG: Grx4 family monothiol glutaredoxin [Gammaproteobacteria bacterium]
MNVQDKIKQQIASDKVVLYMKGTPQFPQCGFSAKSVELLKASGAKFSTFDVLTDPDIRQGIKGYSNWPTIPQLYINGEFIGGCDILTELFQKGELQQMIAKTK